MCLSTSKRSRVYSFILALLLIFSATGLFKTNAYAAGSNAVSAGQKVKITVSVCGSETTGAAVFVLYDTTYFKFLPGTLKWEATTLTQKTLQTQMDTRIDADLAVVASGNGIDSFPITTGTSFLVAANERNNQGTLPRYDLFSFQLEVNANTAISADSFNVTLGLLTTGRFYPPEVKYEVESSGSTPSTTGYSITPTTTATGVTVGTTPFNVDVKLAADQENSPYDGVSAELVFDPAFVSYGTLPGGVSLKPTTSNTLIITRTPTNSNAQVGAAGATIATIPFTPTAAGTAAFSVSNGATITVYGEGANEVSVTSGSALNVTISAPAAKITFGTAYTALPTGYKLLMCELDAKPSVVWNYGASGPAMHYVYTGGKHYVTYIVADAITDSTCETPTATTTAAVDSADINGDGSVRIGDAQIAADLITPHANYAAFGALSIEARLAADVNHDGQITQADADLIVAAIHNGGVIPG